MFFIADLHLHSHYSRATSKDMNLENLWIWAQLKGIQLLSAADFTHPLWVAELAEKLEPAEPGVFQLKDSCITRRMRSSVPESCRGAVRFILSTEISCIYSKGGRTRKVHSLIFAPNFTVVQKLNHRLGAIGNLLSDGRPLLGLDAKLLLKIVLDASRDCILVPAHAWTPHFSVFGANSGFDSLKECFEELTKHIHAIETGLSSDPAMNWRLPSLDNITCISASDAHSLPRLGRECSVFEGEMGYAGFMQALKKDSSRADSRLMMTVEFFPEEGKYHFDGHRNCGVRWHPNETAHAKGVCPRCKRPVTVGVLNRVSQLASRPEGTIPENAVPYKKVIPLAEIIGSALELDSGCATVKREYMALLSQFGPELKILIKTPVSELSRCTHPLIAEGVSRMRLDQVSIEPGFDGEYGQVRLFTEEERDAQHAHQGALF